MITSSSIAKRSDGRSHLPRALRLFSLLLVTPLASVVMAQTPEDATSIGEFLAPGGHVDMERLRSSGHRGPLDTAGFEIQLDAERGPMVRSLHRVEGDDTWADGYHSNGTNQRVLALATFDSLLIAGGDFTAAGPVAADYIAGWDGQDWHALGSGLDGPVHALLDFSPQLIAGGEFTSYVAKWNGSSWSDLTGGLPQPDGPVVALAQYGGGVIAAGNFTVPDQNIGAWSPVGGWASLGGGVSASFGSRVDALTIEPGAPPTLIVGGRFSTCGGATPAANIARWDGSTWTPIAPGLAGRVHALYVDVDPPNWTLYAGGEFPVDTDGDSLHFVAYWDNSASDWMPLGSGLDNHVLSIGEFPDGIYVGGKFLSDSGGSTDLKYVARWDAGWNQLSAGAGDFVYTFSQFGSALFLGGEFDTVGAIAAHHLAKWNGSFWNNVGGNGMSDEVRAMTIYDEDLIVGGTFNAAGPIIANCIARWDGTNWYDLDEGVRVVTSNFPSVDALTSYGSDLIAGGTFDKAGSVDAYNVARWDGMSWYPMGEGLSIGVLALVASADGTTLYAGGPFTEEPTVQTLTHVAQWDGMNWAPMDAGLDGTVNALTIYNGSAVAGGSFQQPVGSSETTNYLAQWNGSLWKSLGGGTDLNGPVFALATKASTSDTLYVGGAFTTPHNYLAQWDGASWGQLDGGGGVNDTVRTLTVFEDSLIVGGMFTMAGSDSANHVARWNGSSWAAFGDGVDDDVLATEGYSGDVFVGGRFLFAGGKPSSYVAERLLALSNVPNAPETPSFWLTLPSPNPFLTETSVSFELPFAANPHIIVYDATGRRVRNLLDRELPAGRHRILWDGRDDRGRLLFGGLYFIRADTETGEVVSQGGSPSLTGSGAGSQRTRETSMARRAF